MRSARIAQVANNAPLRAARCDGGGESVPWVSSQRAVMVNLVKTDTSISNGGGINQDGAVMTALLTPIKGSIGKLSETGPLE